MGGGASGSDRPIVGPDEPANLGLTGAHLGRQGGQPSDRDKEAHRSTLPSMPVRVACYARISTEDQAERQTVAAQTDFLRRYCNLHGPPVAGVSVDDGISGATPLEDRPEGRRLLEDAESGAFTVVLVYRGWTGSVGRSNSLRMARRLLLSPPAASLVVSSGLIGRGSGGGRRR